MKFNSDHIVIFGGSILALELLKYLKKIKFKYHFFTNKRMLSDVIYDNKTLREHLEINKIKFFSTENINTNKSIYKIITPKSLGVSLGLPWIVKKKLINEFNEKLLDIMPIPMPRYRGGAHYTWMILNKNFKGGCFIQNINTKTIQGYRDTGNYYLKYEYQFPRSLKIPEEFYKYACKKEMSFLMKFIKNIKQNKNFTLKKFDESKSIFFPRLLSKLNGFIDWNFDAGEITNFINAFSDPYPGAISFYKGRKIYLKNAKLVEKNNFHPYTSGLILNNYKKKLFISAKKGIIRADFACKDPDIQVGERLFTSQSNIIKSKIHFKF
ncbi:hypothetical protein IDH15_00300 [Pelagibacterales bacterium SAG-MED38]|nr:hypothetical protein [Pelagibacterales bacterium SAG-MED38]